MLRGSDVTLGSFLMSWDIRALGSPLWLGSLLWSWTSLNSALGSLLGSSAALGSVTTRWSKGLGLGLKSLEELLGETGLCSLESGLRCISGPLAMA